MSFTAQKVGDLDGPLPINFLPAALPILQGQTDGDFAVYHADAEDGIQSRVIAGSAFLRDVGAAFPADKQARAFLGPLPSGADAPSLALQRTPIKGTKSGTPTQGRPASHIGIIDTGIAFWNPSFGAERKQFSALGYMSLDEPSGMQGVLSAGDIASLADMAATAGEAAVQTKLGQDYPSSVWAGKGADRLLAPGQFSHGTAMSALVARDADAASQLFGVELPSTAVTDSSGDSLQGILSLAIRNLIQLVADATGTDGRAFSTPLVIVVPYAFLGGPHAKRHGLSAQLSKMLRDLPKKVRKVITIVVPAGNHREDQAHALIRRAGDNMQLRLMPDDHSASTVEMVFRGKAPKFDLRAPNGESVAVKLSKGLRVLEKDGVVIGAIWTQQVDDGSRKKKPWMRSRLTFAPTASRDETAKLCDAGLWTLNFTRSKKLRAWVLRDDNVLSPPSAPPKRQARFEDSNYTKFAASSVFEAPEDVAQSSVKRRGTASALAAATLKLPQFLAVGASWRPDANATKQGDAPYSGLLERAKDQEDLQIVWVDAPRPNDGLLVVANGTKRLFRVSGTSAASAHFAAERARAIAPAGQNSP